MHEILQACKTKGVCGHAPPENFLWGDITRRTTGGVHPRMSNPIMFNPIMSNKHS